MEALEILAALAPIMKALGFFFAGIGVLIWANRRGRD